MLRLCSMLAAVAIVVTVPASSSEAKNPAACKRTNVRPANPQGSVLVQRATRAAATTAVPRVPGRAMPPVVVFGASQGATGAASGISTTGGTVVPSITSEATPQAAWRAAPQVAPRAAPSRTRKKRAGRRSSAVIGLPTLPGAGALAAASSC